MIVDGDGLLAEQEARGAGESERLAKLTSQKHHIHSTDIAGNAINAIINMVEGLGGDSVPYQY